ncbi:MAG: leucyl/phenylalanyl-tRNA--protein transferase [Bacteroidetes bacterium]|nr:MAG: leucyl/phenylalanyl-tRNA--protein transferase [Bacteroidota bacterium]
MPIYALTEALMFPDPERAHPDGILAVGGDLRPERLLLAYEHGIFPWFSAGDPILWWSPDPRFVLYPDELKVQRSMRPILNQQKFQITYDQAFAEVIKNCRHTPRPGQRGTWITPEMQAAYLNLHQEGYAHSVEVWQEGALVGGLYGVSLGRCYFGESMFAQVSNASKAGFITLVRDLMARDFALIDCQVYTSHLESLGAREIPRRQFLDELHTHLQAPDLRGNWGQLLQKKVE